jgi:anionic cell wall polymer biosynthesis LytR-Cps2A-Psr (LCP) family protein
VTVTTTKDINDDKSQLHLKAGTHHLDGKTALAFARTRHGVGDGSDLGRIELQQQLLHAMLKQVSSADLLTNPAKIYGMAETITSAITTDTELDSLSELVSFGSSLRQIGSDNLTAITIPVATAPSDPNRVVETSSASEVWKALKNDTAVPKSVLDAQK